MGPSLALARGLSPVQRDAVGCKTSPREEPATSPYPLLRSRKQQILAGSPFPKKSLSHYRVCALGEAVYRALARGRSGHKEWPCSGFQSMDAKAESPLVQAPDLPRNSHTANDLTSLCFSFLL